MIDLTKFKINYEELEAIEKEAEINQGYNPACQLISYWSERMPAKMKKEMFSKGGLPYGYVGDGWPQYSDQAKAIEMDTRNLHKFYKYPHCRDIGDAIYQANTLYDLFPKTKKSLRVVDFGGGYGRLAIPFILHCEKIEYFSVDSVPLSLLIAPQILRMCASRETKILNWKSQYDQKLFVDKTFASVPAWRINEISRQEIDIFISIHSFQEMTKEAVEFYINFADQNKHFKKRDDIFFYSINLWPEEKYVPDSWELIFDRPFPINRDGSFCERCWRIK